MNALPLPNGATTGIGSAEFAASYSDPASFNVSALRLDAKASDTLTTFVRVSHGPSDSQTRTGALSTVNHTTVDNDAITGGATWVAGSSTTGDLRVNWTRNAPHGFNELTTFGGATIPAASDVFSAGRDASQTLSTFTSPLGNFSWGPGSRDVQRQFNAVGTAAWLTGSHQVKLGVDYRRVLPLLGGHASENVTFTTVTGTLIGQTRAYQISNVDGRQREPIFSELSIYAQDTWRASRHLTLTYGFRFERVPPPTEASGRSARTLLGIDTATLQNPRLAPEGTALWRERAGELAPRVGAAYQVITRLGWESTIRSGVGLFYDPGLGDVATAFQSVYPYANSTTTFNATFPLPDSIRVPPPLGVSAPSVLVLLDPNLRMPYTIQWHASWEQNFGVAQTLSVAYIGASGHRLLTQQLYNQPLAEWPTTNTSMVIFRNFGHSAYRAVQLQYQRRLHRGLQALASYSLASSKDNSSADNIPAPPADFADVLVREYSPSDFDVRHQLSASVMYEIPAPSRWPMQLALRGWRVDLLLRTQSAPPTNPLVTTVILPNNTNYSLRPDIVLGRSLYIYDAALPGGQRLNPAAFVAPTGVQGNVARNSLRSFGASQVDLAIRRQFGLGGGARVQINAELFNLFNHPNFGPLTTSLSDPLFGEPKKLLNSSLGGLSPLYQMGGPRSVQLAVKFLF
jgi:hypothetical protein